jgi:hypothetical protein
MLCIGLFWAAGLLLWAAEESPVYPLKQVIAPDPNDRNNGPNGEQSIEMGKNGEGSMDFATPSGKLRVKLDGDKLLVDRSGDGKFDTAIVPAQWASKVTVKVQGPKAFEYLLFLTASREPGSSDLSVSATSLMHLESQVGQTVVRLFDTNLNGRFGDPGDMMQIGAEGGVRAITKYVEIEGKIRELQVVNGGEGVKLPPYTGPTGTLKLQTKEGWNTVAQLEHAEGIFAASPKNAESLLIPGAYRFVGAQAQFGAKTTANGREQYPIQLYSSGGKGAPIQIKEGQNSLALGPPFRLEFAAARSTLDAANVTISSVFLVGSGGEQYYAANYGANRDSTLTCFVRAAGREQAVSTLSYG